MTMTMSRLEILGCIWGARLTRERRRLERVSTWPFWMTVFCQLDMAFRRRL